MEFRFNTTIIDTLIDEYMTATTEYFEKETEHKALSETYWKLEHATDETYTALENRMDALASDMKNLYSIMDKLRNAIEICKDVAEIF